MFGRLKIKGKVYVAAVLVTLMVAVAAGVGYIGLVRQEATLSSVVLTSGALRSHLEADMMHDALRADVLAALQLGQMTPPEAQTAIRADLAEHVALFRETIATNAGRPLGDDIKAALGEVAPRLSAYIESAETIVDTAFTDTAAANAQYPGFGAAFSELEEAMSAVSDHIEGATKTAEAEARSSVQMSEMALLVTGVLTLGLVVLGSFAFIRNIVRPLNGMTSVMSALATGDTGVEVPARDRQDEIGGMAQSVQVFKEAAIRERELTAAREREQAAVAARASTVDRLCQAFDTKVGSVLEIVRTAVTGVQSTAGTMSSTAAETSRQSAAVAEASDQASTNVQTVAGAAEELSASVAEISRRVEQSAQIAGKAVAEAEHTNARVKGLAEAAQKIGEVVKLINDIAEQTNLLALNATIEAARAGEAGKGFAVVANEVKSLANQTAKATEEIGAQIGAMQGATGEAVSAIGSIGATIGEINEIASAIAAAIAEQGAATQEIARNVQDAASGTAQVSGNIGSVTQAAAETGHAAEELLDAAQSLAVETERLRGEVTSFLTDVRAA